MPGSDSTWASLNALLYHLEIEDANASVVRMSVSKGKLCDSGDVKVLMPSKELQGN